MLILSSCDFRSQKAKDAILQHLPKPIGDCRVLFIPNEKATHESIVSGKYHRRLEEFGFCADNVTVFDHTCPDAFRNLDIDAIYISGGNTFLTLQKLRDTTFDKDIIRYVRNGVTYIGGSAGAHIASNNIAHVAAFDDVPNGMTDLSGLSLFDGVLICHYTPEREAYYQQLQADCTCPVYTLTDDDVMVIPPSLHVTLVRPTLAHKAQVLDMVAEFAEHGSPINGDGFLSDFLRDATYEAWVEQLETASDPATCPNGRAPALTYFGVRESDGRIVGMIDLRLELNDHLRTHGGHIGYAVRPTERGKHYATDMLKAALEIYKERGTSELLFICSKENTASAKVITNCGGVLKDEIYSNVYGEILQRYTISLMKHHTMDLVPSAFQKIANGSKTIELRLNDPKRQAIVVGDHILFRNTETDERLEVIVRARHEFATFEELYAALPLSKCGYTEDELSTAHPNDMHAYYTDEQISLHGVVGIEISRL